MHVMLDIETMGTRADAAIVAIGAVRFDTQIPTSFYTTIDLGSAMQHGRVDGSTVLFWMRQNEAAREQIYRAKATLKNALLAFRSWLIYPNDANEKTTYVWGRGPSFDCRILRTAFEATGVPCPWVFRNERCVRTILDLCPVTDDEVKAASSLCYLKLVEHIAIDDALRQAFQVRAAYKKLGLSLTNGTT
jgi:exodeoxyribonuclease VIII